MDGLLWRPTAARPDEDEDVVLDIVKSWAADIASWNLSKNRAGAVRADAAKRAALHASPREQATTADRDPQRDRPDVPFEVHSIRPSMRIDWDEHGHASSG